MGIVKKASFKSTDAIQAPGSISHKTFLIDSVLKCGVSIYLFSFFKFSITLKIPSGFGLKKYWRIVLLPFHYLFLFSTPFFKSFLITLSKIYVSIVFLECSKFELPIRCWLRLTFKPCCTILRIYLSFVRFFQFSK